MNSEDATSPAGLASFLRVLILQRDGVPGVPASSMPRQGHGGATADAETVQGSDAVCQRGAGVAAATLLLRPAPFTRRTVEGIASWVRRLRTRGRGTGVPGGSLGLGGLTAAPPPRTSAGRDRYEVRVAHRLAPSSAADAHTHTAVRKNGSAKGVALCISCASLKWLPVVRSRHRLLAVDRERPGNAA